MRCPLEMPWMPFRGKNWDLLWLCKKWNWCWKGTHVLPWSPLSCWTIHIVLLIKLLIVHLTTDSRWTPVTSHRSALLVWNLLGECGDKVSLYSDCVYELLVTNVGCGVCRPPYMAAAIIDQRGVSLGARWRVELQTKVRKDLTITEKAPTPGWKHY